MDKKLNLTMLIFLLLFVMESGLNAQTSFFSPVRDKDLPRAVEAVKSVKKINVVRLNEPALRNYLLSAPMEFARKGKTLLLDIPLPTGETETFDIVESPILSKEVAAQYPEIKTYSGTGLTHREASIRFALTSTGFSAILLGLDGDAVYFEHYSKEDPTVYFSYLVSDARIPEGFTKPICGVEGDVHKALDKPSGEKMNGTGANLLTYRLAIAGNVEFTNNNGGTQAGGFAKIVSYVNTLNAIYRRELSVAFTLVSGTNLVFTTEPDGYTNSNQIAMLTENQAKCDAVIGNANYDVGHVMGFEGGSGGGIAAGSSVCDAATKGQGVSGEGAPPYAQVFSDQLVLHEIGHQFGMNHSYNSSLPVCTTRNQPTSVEPGAGATIMSYGFTCGTDDYFTSTTFGPILNFHSTNYSEAVAYIGTTSCAATTATGNTAPGVVMPAAATIPKSTPFALIGGGTNSGPGDAFTYCWEGMNVGTIAPPDASTLDDPSKPPFFRSYDATSTASTRTYPLLSAILNGTNQAKGDKLPSVGIATVHRLTVRDNNPAGGGVSFGQITITVDGNIGPFLETTNLAGSYLGGSNQTITWSVNGTNVATPNIKILLSTDGGFNFPHVLLASTPNDGSQMVTFPNVSTSTARIKVESIGNIFFDISNVDFTITQVACTPPVVTAPTVTQPTCSLPTGTIVVNATGSGPLEYSIDNGTTWVLTNTFSLLNPNSYNIKVRLQSSPTCMATYAQNPVVIVAPTGCCTPVTLPANGASEVACPALAVQPTPPVVLNQFGVPIIPTGPVIANAPNPLTCEGTRTYSWTYLDCSNVPKVWSYVYTVERNSFTVPANSASVVACPTLIVQPTPPTVMSNCGEPLTPTGPVIVNNPNPISCEGTRTYTWTYTDCEGNTNQWSHVVTVERQSFGVPANGSATVACPDQTDVQPAAPVVTSNCGEVLTPVVTSTAKPGCEGNRNWYFVYVDCEGNTATWVFIYTVKYLNFTIPANVVSNVECPINAFQPTPPMVKDNCGKTLIPIGPNIVNTNNASGCEGSRRYEWTYMDCKGNTQIWKHTFNFLYSADFFAPADEQFTVSCLAYAVPPVPQTLYDFCGKPITIVGPTMTQNITGCAGWRKYSYIYKDCGGHSHPWSFTYFINDNQPPSGFCPSSGTIGGGGGGISMGVTNVSCLDDLPCPENYNFTPIIKQLLVDGHFVDECSGTNLVVHLDSWSAVWDCSDPDGDGQFTFGRTYYFSIADQCGNEFPDLCSVTFSGSCQPMSNFSQQTWGLSIGGEGINLLLIEQLLGQGPIVIGGANRSLTLTQAQCIIDLLPGQGSISELNNCQQLNCTGCNPVGPGGIKNMLAGNAIALELNLRTSGDGTGAQSLGCIYVHPCITNCQNGNCVLRVFDQNGNQHTFPYTVDGLNSLANQYLGDDLNLNSGQSVIYGTAINQAIDYINNYGVLGQPSACGQGAGASFVGGNPDKALPTSNIASTVKLDFSIAPNPTDGTVNFKMERLEDNQAVTVTIYNYLGVQMLRKDFGQVTSVNEQLDLTNLGNGLYLVSVKAGVRHFVKTLVVQH